MFELLAQLCVFPVQAVHLFQFALHLLVDRGKRHFFGQLEFALGDALADQIRIVRLRPQLQIFFEVVNRPRPVGGERLVIDQTEFEMRRGTTGVGRQRLFKGVDGALVIQGGHAVFAREIIGVFLLIPAAFAQGRAAAPARAE